MIPINHTLLTLGPCLNNDFEGRLIGYFTPLTDTYQICKPSMVMVDFWFVSFLTFKDLSRHNKQFYKKVLTDFLFYLIEIYKMRYRSILQSKKIFWPFCLYCRPFEGHISVNIELQRESWIQKMIPMLKASKWAIYH